MSHRTKITAYAALTPLTAADVLQSPRRSAYELQQCFLVPWRGNTAVCASEPNLADQIRLYQTIRPFLMKKCEWHPCMRQIEGAKVGLFFALIRRHHDGESFARRTTMME